MGMAYINDTWAERSLHGLGFFWFLCTTIFFLLGRKKNCGFCMSRGEHFDGFGGFVFVLDHVRLPCQKVDPNMRRCFDIPFPF